MTTTAEFDLGQRVAESITFQDPATKANVDPGTVSFKFRDPDGIIVTYVFGTDSQLVKDAVGQYRVEIDADKPLTYKWRWFSTGAWKAAVTGSFYVRPSEV